MKITSLISASAMVLALAAPVYAQTGIPASYLDLPAVQQVDAQLSAQGYTITDVVENTNGSYSILSKSPTGQLRLITINPATGKVNDTVTNGVPTGTPGVSPEGTLAHEGNETEAMEAVENDGDGNGNDRGHGGGSDNGGGNDNDGGHGGGNDNDGGSDNDGGHGGGNDNDGGSDNDGGHDGGHDGGSDNDD